MESETASEIHTASLHIVTVFFALISSAKMEAFQQGIEAKCQTWHADETTLFKCVQMDPPAEVTEVLESPPLLLAAFGDFVDIGFAGSVLWPGRNPDKSVPCSV